MTSLLVSVRNAEEAETALAGGAALIDIKETSRGALGRADDPTIAAVVEYVAGRCEVSAALGELEENLDVPAAPVQFVKWGLAGAAGMDWRKELGKRMQRAVPQTVTVAYADWQCAGAPPFDDVVAFACQRPGSVLLVDTHCKETPPLSLRRKPTLLDWLSLAEVMELCERCREAGLRLALAGSLGAEEIKALLPARPDWFAVRGAVCGGGDRSGAVDDEKVRALVRLIRGAATRRAG